MVEVVLPGALDNFQQPRGKLGTLCNVREGEWADLQHRDDTPVGVMIDNAGVWSKRTSQNKGVREEKQTDLMVENGTSRDQQGGILDRRVESSNL